MELKRIEYLLYYIDQAYEALIEDLGFPRSYQEQTILIKLDEARMWLQEVKLLEINKDDLDHDDTE